jgi:hypothetical protein
VVEGLPSMHEGLDLISNIAKKKKKKKVTVIHQSKMPLTIKQTQCTNKKESKKNIFS